LLHRLIGLRIPRDVEAQFTAGRKVEYPFRQGDLVFFGNGQDASASHVAVSLGEWRILHSSLARNGVYLDDIQHVPELKGNYLGACSFL
jgi:cell wall-associated NlpC family hydrolase